MSKVAVPPPDLVVPPVAPPPEIALPDNSATAMYERLLRDPAVDVAKLKELFALHERQMANVARGEFNAAYALMQGEIPVINEKGQILVQGEIRSTYARNEDIQPIIKPILAKYGFALRFRNETLSDGRLKITGILGHRSGHSEQDEFVTAPDSGGRMNDIQRLASARSYGARYCTIALLNIATALEDDDGVKAGTSALPEQPAKYQEWVLDLTAVADEGLAALEKAWEDSPKANKVHLVRTDKQKWERLKIKAAEVDKKRK